MDSDQRPRVNGPSRPSSWAEEVRSCLATHWSSGEGDSVDLVKARAAYERVWVLAYSAAFWYLRKSGHPEAEDLGAEAAVHAVEAFLAGLPRNLDHSPGFFLVVLRNQCFRARRDWARRRGRMADSGEGGTAAGVEETPWSRTTVTLGGTDGVAEMRQCLRDGLLHVCEHVLRLEDVAAQLRGDARLKRHMLQGAAAFYRGRLARAGPALDGFDTAEEARARIEAADPVRTWEAVGLPEEPGELFTYIGASVRVDRNSFDQRAKELRRQHGVTLSAFPSQDGAI